MKRRVVRGRLHPPHGAHAQVNDWPTRPVTVVVGYAAGGNTDVMARMASRKLAEDLKQRTLSGCKNGVMNGTIRECSLLLVAITIWTVPASARSYLNCLTKKVVIVDAPRGSTSSSSEEKLGFWVDDAAKTIVLADGTPLTVRRFDDHWISATHNDVSYEFNRQNGNLAYASSTTKDGAVTIIIGSGQCEIVAGPAG
jgi:hypothetical protein